MDVLSDWSAPPAEPRVGDHDVHLWRAFLDCDVRIRERLQLTLATDEQARPSRFAFPLDRNRFVVGRGILRAILGRYLERPAYALEFAYEAKGKPRVRLREADPPIQFNVSHSHGLAEVAVSSGREIGIDIEAIRSDVAVEDISDRIFSPDGRCGGRQGLEFAIVGLGVERLFPPADKRSSAGQE